MPAAALGVKQSVDEKRYILCFWPFFFFEMKGTKMESRTSFIHWHITPPHAVFLLPSTSMTLAYATLPVFSASKQVRRGNKTLAQEPRGGYTRQIAGSLLYNTRESKIYVSLCARYTSLRQRVTAVLLLCVYTVPWYFFCTAWCTVCPLSPAVCSTLTACAR